MNLADRSADIGGDYSIGREREWDESRALLFKPNLTPY